MSSEYHEFHHHYGEKSSSWRQIAAIITASVLSLLTLGGDIHTFNEIGDNRAAIERLDSQISRCQHDHDWPERA